MGKVAGQLRWRAATIIRQLVHTELVGLSGNSRRVNILAIDTSSDAGSAAVTIAGSTVAEVRLAKSLQHSENLFRSIEFLLSQSALSLADIDLFAAARGPGSFTGLRVGLAAIGGVAFAGQKDSAGISTLRAWAWQVGQEDRIISPILDARRGDIYGALYRRDGEELIELRAPTVLQPAEWLSQIPGGPTVFCGTGTGIIRSEILGTPEWKIVDSNPYLAVAVAQLTATQNREPLEPLYIRPSDAEAQKKS